MWSGCRIDGFLSAKPSHAPTLTWPFRYASEIAFSPDSDPTRPSKSAPCSPEDGPKRAAREQDEESDGNNAKAKGALRARAWCCYSIGSSFWRSGSQTTPKHREDQTVRHTPMCGDGAPAGAR